MHNKKVKETMKALETAVSRAIDFTNSSAMLWDCG